MRLAQILHVMIVLACVPGLASADDILLDLDHDATTSDIDLLWSGGLPIFDVFRAPNPITLDEPSHHLGLANGWSWVDAPAPLAPGGLHYYLVREAPICGNGLIDTGEPCDYMSGSGACCSSSCEVCSYEIAVAGAEEIELSGQGIGAVFTRDFDGLGVTDLMLVHPNENNAEVTVYFGEREPGAATFDNAESSSAGAFVRGIDLADFDDDGLIDLAVGSQGGFSGSLVLGSLCGSDGNANHRFPLLRGLGDGSFAFHSCLTMADTFGWHDSNINGLRVADLDEDGEEDIVISRQGNYGPKVVLAYFGQGDFTFSERVVIYDSGTSGNRPKNVEVGDFTDNGHLDILVETFSSTFLFEGDGRGEFAQTGYGGPWPVATTEVNVDGFVDLVTSQGQTIEIRYGLPGGDFLDPPQVLSIDPHSRVVVADFDGDGFSDVLTLDRNLGENVIGRMHYGQAAP